MCSQKRHGKEQQKWPRVGVTSVEGEGKMSVPLL